MHARAVREQDSTEGEREKDEYKGEEDGSGVALAVEEVERGEVGEELAVVGGGGGDGVVGKTVGGGEGGEEEGGGVGRVEGEEGVGGVGAGEGEEWEGAAGVAVEPGGDVVDLAVDGDPGVVARVMLAKFIGGNVGCGRLHWSRSDE